MLDLDTAHCPNCGVELKIIAAILEQPVIDKILTDLGLRARARLVCRPDGCPTCSAVVGVRPGGTQLPLPQR